MSFIVTVKKGEEKEIYNLRDGKELTEKYYDLLCQGVKLENIHTKEVE